MHVNSPYKSKRYFQMISYCCKKLVTVGIKDVPGTTPAKESGYETTHVVA
ncbi:hypothetical protein SEGD1_203 [Enterobacteria phage SEGD1]|uniref:Uncharacterized protein n=1 Tax=Enterobacteria phage SEGD1 TaxID=1805456 RepID=A0A142IIR2_9CAUD|nr:hypothetical protein SEGD1_203 [Enterobacteria phage SEGD1]